MNRKVEFIESYIKVGNDYQWSDNHGELIRCKDCKYFEDGCNYFNGWIYDRAKREDYCSRAKRKEE